MAEFGEYGESVESLRWLKDNNPYYADVTIDDEGMANVDWRKIMKRAEDVEAEYDEEERIEQEKESEVAVGRSKDMDKKKKTTKEKESGIPPKGGDKEAADVQPAKKRKVKKISLSKEKQIALMKQSEMEDEESAQAGLSGQGKGRKIKLSEEKKAQLEESSNKLRKR